MIRKLTKNLAHGALALGVLSLAACETPAPPPVAVVVAPPPAPVAPPITLAPRVIQAASAYQTYVRQASNISPSFADGLAVQSSLRQGAAYEPKQLASGEIAYAAIVALQDPVFVAEVRKFAADPMQRAKVRDSILTDPAYVIGFTGSDTAAGLVIAALNGEGSRVRGVGELVRQAAYDVQRQSWSKIKIPEPELRLAEAKTLSAASIAPSATDTDRLSQAALGLAPLPLTGTAAAPPYTPAVIRGLAIAALAALGEAGEENARYLDALMADPNGDYCLKMSKLNLYQCLAVAKPWYEDVFCLGQHVLIDTGQCIAKTAGDLPPPPLLIPAATTPAPLQTPIPDQAMTTTTPTTTGAAAAAAVPTAPVAVSAESAGRPALSEDR